MLDHCLRRWASIDSMARVCQDNVAFILSNAENVGPAQRFVLHGFATYVQ